MSLLIDSAKIDEVRQAIELGYVTGVTTNPALMARVDRPAVDVIADICTVARGPVFYQVTGDTPEEREREAREFHTLCPDKLVLKIPATTVNMKLVAKLAPGIPCAVTAMFGEHQALAACAAGARYLIPYVNRATRLMGDGCGLVAELAAVAEACGTGAEVLAASIKTPAEAVAATLAGADHLTLTLPVLEQLGDHPLSEQAIEQFRRAGA
jgi:transaldolase